MIQHNHTLEISKCSECPLKGEVRDHGSSSDCCSHPDLKPEGWGGRDIPRETVQPDWCPLQTAEVTIKKANPQPQNFGEDVL